MEQIVQQFTNEQFGELRTVEQDGRVLFCAKDVAAALGYANSNKAIGDHCKGVPIRYPLETAGGTQQARFITEGDVYRLIAHSKLEGAQRFESWVFDEVLPSIRRTGGYVAAGPDETPEQILARAVLVAQDTIERQKARIDEAERHVKDATAAQMLAEAKLVEARPKALFADAVSASKTSILVGDLAKLLRQNGFEVGQNRLFALLREQGWLCNRKGAMWNMPTQRAMERGYFEVKETAITHSDGHVTINKTPKVSGKGQVYFVNRFCGGKFE